MTDQLDCALDLMRRLPPTQIEDNLAGLIDLLPDLAEDLLSAVDQPLKIAHDKQEKKDYLLCEYNRDGDSYRSPWSNKYDPPLSDGALPPKELRLIEVQGNEIFDTYRELYFEGGVSSLYCWESSENSKGFAAVILIKKSQDQSKKGQPMKGTWDSIHVVDVADKKTKAQYKLTSTVMLSLETQTEQTGQVSLSGNLTRQDEKEFPVNEANPHLINIGRMVEDMEIRLRNTIETIYFGKTKDIANMLRQSVKVSETRQKQLMQKQIGSSLGRG
eukprot:TRINITY_DN10456_c0_g1_i1.p1 TRINITY_DN10456_c0_g1~~TRINITY_DN10456_c0_g1_i1.p1  ORF type:complete len:273 (+),score=57.15 TRINITY_DN10456_c0_g1_i1:48-866(+)